MKTKRRLCAELLETRLVPTVWYLHPGGDLQATIDHSVNSGDSIYLDAGATFTGPITLRAKTSGITIATNSFPLSQGVRVSPSDASSMAKILAPSFYAAVQTEPGASGYILRGLEILPVSSSATVDTLVTLGDGSSNQTIGTILPNNITIDQCFIHGYDEQTIKRGIGLNDGQSSVTNSYISNFKSASQDTQAIAGWNGSGPYLIQNNYLEAAGENVIFGGGYSWIQQVPSGITVTNNTISKPLFWDPYRHPHDHTTWSVKNLLELKNADTVLIANNTFQNNWVQSQAGTAILLTPRGAQSGGSWVTVSNVTISHNTLNGTAQGIEILGSDDMSPGSKVTTNIKIQNNLFGDVASGNPLWGSASPPKVFLFAPGVNGGPSNVIIDHNTILQNAGGLLYLGGTVTGFQFTYNIVPQGEYGVIGSGLLGTAALDAFCPGYVFSNNVIVFSGAVNVTYPPGTAELANNNWSAVFGSGYQQSKYDDPGTYVAIGAYSGDGSNIVSFSTPLF